MLYTGIILSPVLLALLGDCSCNTIAVSHGISWVTTSTSELPIAFSTSPSVLYVTTDRRFPFCSNLCHKLQENWPNLVSKNSSWDILGKKHWLCICRQGYINTQVWLLGFFSVCVKFSHKVAANMKFTRRQDTGFHNDFGQCNWTVLFFWWSRGYANFKWILENNLRSWSSKAVQMAQIQNLLRTQSESLHLSSRVV